MKKDTWYCAGWSRELAAGPVGRQLLGQHVALFRDASGTARALGARCPHRGADLARGSVIDGCIECPFHGWRFDGDGHCVRVPSQPEGMKISTLARVPAFPLQELHGTLWIWMGNGEPQRGDPPHDPVSQPSRSVRRLFFDAQLVEAPFLTVLENAFDKAHLPFIHRRSFGPDQVSLVARQQVSIDADGRGLRAHDDARSPWHVEPKVPRGLVGVLGPVFFGLRTPIAQHMRFHVNAGVQIYQEYPNGTFDLFIAHLTPADDAHTWLFVQSVRTRAPHAVGDWIQRRAINKVFAEGKQETSVILGVDARTVPPRVSVESDRVGLAARQLYERWTKSGDRLYSASDVRDLEAAEA